MMDGPGFFEEAMSRNFRTDGIALLVSLAVLTTSSAANADTPSKLYGKTVVLRWQEYRVQRADNGDISRSNTSSSLVVYISDAGRLFTRLSRTSGRRSNSNDVDPEGGNQGSGTGAASNLTTSFEGSRLLISNSMKSGARQIEASFNPTFSGCSLKVRFGREGNAEIRHRAMNGRMYNIISTDVSGATCSIRSGNALGAG